MKRQINSPGAEPCSGVSFYPVKFRLKRTGRAGFHGVNLFSSRGCLSLALLLSYGHRRPDLNVWLFVA